MKLPVFLAAVGRWATGMVAEARKPTFSTSREGWVGLARGVQRIE